ncbi:MAG: formate dehydrogenase subunit alpha [Alcaligenaceae bacterium]|nr:formate dehydrogenase subunit alpha [Alcaligenaceae bacterium]
MLETVVIRNRDLGTPEVTSDVLIKLTIDDHPVEVPAGTSIMRAAMIAGITIPKLCATEALEAFGSCRVCLVQIEGRRGFPASCTTPVEEGLVVTTENKRLNDLRRHVMELYISDHPLDCLTCPANGNCELQDTVGQVGLREVRYGFDGVNHRQSTIDDSNPYFTFDPSLCIVCSRCVRACEETQGTFALTVENRGFDSVISTGANSNFLESDCVSCGACVNDCPTGALIENTVIAKGQPTHAVVTTCAYCGVGCGLKAELKGEEIIRMTPWKDGKANEGHACVKGRFAWGYVDHPDRITTPMIRSNINEAWRQVSWEEAINYAAAEIKRIQSKYGIDAVGGITSSRCTNEESYLVQKLVRAGFGNNNVDTCARVCHSPTGFGLKQTLGESAGTQTFESVADSDVIVVMGANPSDAHPVFASRMKRRIREGAKLIVIDPRATNLVSSAHIKADYHLALRPGTNVAILNAFAHVIVKEGLYDQGFVASRCEEASFKSWLDFICRDDNSPETVAEHSGVAADTIRAAARLYAGGGKAAIYYGLGVTEHAQGSTAVMAIANLAMLTGNLGKSGVGVNPLRGQNNVQGSCDMGSFPHELPGYRHVSNNNVRTSFEKAWGVSINPEPGLRIPNMFNAALSGSFKALYCQGEDILQSDPNTQHVEAALRAMECVIVQDLFLNETAKFAHVFLPGSSFLEKDGTFTNAERRISRVRKVTRPRSAKADWEITVALAKALGYEMNYQHPREIMDEIARLTPTFANVSYEFIEKMGGSVQWPCNNQYPEGSPIMHIDSFSRDNGKGLFIPTTYIPTSERVNKRYPLLLTTGRILSQYNVGAQTRRTSNHYWHAEDVLEIHPQDASDRGIKHGDFVKLASRSGETVLRADVSMRMQPSVVYTTFHHPSSGANVITTDNSDWATNCPEYKVTAVEVQKVAADSSDWQKRWHQEDKKQREFAGSLQED